MNLVVDIGNSNLKWTRVGDGPWQAGESVTVSGDISGRLANDIIKDMQVILDREITWPRGYTFQFTGEQGSIQ